MPTSIRMPGGNYVTVPESPQNISNISQIVEAGGSVSAVAPPPATAAPSPAPIVQVKVENKPGETDVQAYKREQQEFRAANPSMYPAPIVTMPSGQNVPVSEGFAAKVEQGRLSDLNTPMPFNAQRITEQQYAEKYPEQYRAERMGFASSASDVQVSRSQEAAQAASEAARQNFLYPQPKSYFEVPASPEPAPVEFGLDLRNIGSTTFQNRYNNSTDHINAVPNVAASMTKDWNSTVYKPSIYDISVARTTYEGLSPLGKAREQAATLFSSEGRQTVGVLLGGKSEYGDTVADVAVGRMARIYANRELGTGATLRDYTASPYFFGASLYGVGKLAPYAIEGIGSVLGAQAAKGVTVGAFGSGVAMAGKEIYDTSKVGSQAELYGTTALNVAGFASLIKSPLRLGETKVSVPKGVEIPSAASTQYPKLFEGKPQLTLAEAKAQFLERGGQINVISDAEMAKLGYPKATGLYYRDSGTQPETIYIRSGLPKNMQEYQISNYAGQTSYGRGTTVIEDNVLKHELTHALTGIGTEEVPIQFYGFRQPTLVKGTPNLDNMMYWEAQPKIVVEQPVIGTMEAAKDVAMPKPLEASVANRAVLQELKNKDLLSKPHIGMSLKAPSFVKGQGKMTLLNPSAEALKLGEKPSITSLETIAGGERFVTDIYGTEMKAAKNPILEANKIPQTADTWAGFTKKMELKNVETYQNPDATIETFKPIQGQGNGEPITAYAHDISKFGKQRLPEAFGQKNVVERQKLTFPPDKTATAIMEPSGIFDVKPTVVRGVKVSGALKTKETGVFSSIGYESVVKKAGKDTYRVRTSIPEKNAISDILFKVKDETKPFPTSEKSDIFNLQSGRGVKSQSGLVSVNPKLAESIAKSAATATARSAPKLDVKAPSTATAIKSAVSTKNLPYSAIGASISSAARGKTVQYINMDEYFSYPKGGGITGMAISAPKKPSQSEANSLSSTGSIGNVLNTAPSIEVTKTGYASKVKSALGVLSANVNTERYSQIPRSAIDAISRTISRPITRTSTISRSDVIPKEISIAKQMTKQMTKQDTISKQMTRSFSPSFSSFRGKRPYSTPIKRDSFFGEKGRKSGRSRLSVAIHPLADLYSKMITEARTGRPATHQAPTRKVAERFLRTANFGYFPTAEMVRGRAGARSPKARISSGTRSKRWF